MIVAVVTWQAGDVTGQHDPHELDAFLASIPFFASLDEATRLQLAEQLEPVHVAAGDVVIAQDDAGDGLFVLLSGRLRVSVMVGGTERTLHDLARGAIIGEIALLSNRPRSATVRAVRDSDLLLLRVSAFNALVGRTPGLLGEVARLLVDRLLAVDRPQLPPTGSRTIAVAPAGSSAGPAAELAAQLTDLLARAGSVIRLDADVVANHLGTGAAQREPGDSGRHELTGWLHAVERGHDHVVYQTDAQDTAWSRLCLSQSDVVLLTGDAAGDPRLGPVESRALATPSLRCELVLVHPSGPSATSRWLGQRPVVDFHHLRGGHTEDAARLARMVTGTACGVVLGGGGPRGFAHLGALRALEEAGVPIDVVGGTSIGAVMGALCAQGLSDEQRVEQSGHRLHPKRAPGPLHAPAGRAVVGPQGGPAPGRTPRVGSYRGLAAALLLCFRQPDPGRGGRPRAGRAVACGTGQPVPSGRLPAGLRRRRSARRRCGLGQCARRGDAGPDRKRAHRRR